MLKAPMISHTAFRIDEPAHRDLLLGELVRDGYARFMADSVEDVQLFMKSLGHVFVEDDTDAVGIKTVIDSAKGAFPHTDRSSHKEPPNLIAIWCRQQAELGGDTLLVDGRDLYYKLRRDSPEAFEALGRLGAAYFGYPDHVSSGAVFNNGPMGTAIIKFRYDRYGFYNAEVLAHLKLILDFISANPTRFRLQDKEGYLCANHRLLHGALPSSGEQERIVYRVLASVEYRTACGLAFGNGFDTRESSPPASSTCISAATGP